ncbi:MAG: glycine--tRNA ligase subunit beta, partial [Actinomycetota bacterium]
KDKCGRLVELSGQLASTLGLSNGEKKTLATAAGLAKADQVSVMVHEFPELEGYMGSVYAEREGYHAAVRDAIAEQYLPALAGGELPRSVPGALLSVCDKIDNIMGAFAVDEIPSGSRDPYGLRRASAGIIEINERFGFDYNLPEMLGSSLNLFKVQGADINEDAGVLESAYGFIYARLQNRMVEKGTPVEVIAAARQAGITSTNRVIALAGALDLFRSDSRFDDLYTAYFRSSKIAAKAGSEGDSVAAAINPELFEEDAERELFKKLNELEPRLKELTGSGDYEAALIEASEIRPEVDRYFDDVLVMADDENLRLNRLALLSHTVDLLVMLGDPMKVAAAPK